MGKTSSRFYLPHQAAEVIAAGYTIVQRIYPAGIVRQTCLNPKGRKQTHVFEDGKLIPAEIDFIVIGGSYARYRAFSVTHVVNGIEDLVLKDGKFCPAITRRRNLLEEVRFLQADRLHDRAIGQPIEHDGGTSNAPQVAVFMRNHVSGHIVSAQRADGRALSEDELELLCQSDRANMILSPQNMLVNLSPISVPDLESLQPFEIIPDAASLPGHVKKVGARDPRQGKWSITLDAYVNAANSALSASSPRIIEIKPVVARPG